jgi:hypothetical protein
MTYLSGYAQVNRTIWQVKSLTIRTTLECALRISIKRCSGKGVKEVKEIGR